MEMLFISRSFVYLGLLWRFHSNRRDLLWVGFSFHFCLVDRPSSKFSLEWTLPFHI